MNGKTGRRRRLMPGHWQLHELHRLYCSEFLDGTRPGVPLVYERFLHSPERRELQHRIARQVSPHRSAGVPNT